MFYSFYSRESCESATISYSLRWVTLHLFYFIFYFNIKNINNNYNMHNLHCITDTIGQRRDKIQKEKENKGLFGLFRKGSRKQSEQVRTEILYEKTAVITQ